MVTLQQKKLSLVLIIASMTMQSIQTGLAQTLPPPPLVPNLPGALPPQPGNSRTPGPFPGNEAQIQQCLAALATIPGCVLEIASSLLSGQLGKLGIACCSAISAFRDRCWPQLFPLNPLFPPDLLKNACSGSGQVSNTQSVLNQEKDILPAPRDSEIAQCWYSLANVAGSCSIEIHKLLVSGQVGSVGRFCCAAVSGVRESCWSKLPPLKHSIPLQLRSSCSASAPAPN